MSSYRFLPEIADSMGVPIPRLQITGSGALPSIFWVTELAAESLGMAAAMLQRHRQGGASKNPPPTVDRRLASFWFAKSLRPDGWQLPPTWDSIAGDYQAADSWIRLHTNAPLHRHRALAVLGLSDDKTNLDPTVVREAVASWAADHLEQAIVEAGGCAAAMRSITDWPDHPQGVAVAAEPVIALQTTTQTDSNSCYPPAQRPLQGVRVLDLTRVLAGPVAGRFLAGYGAQVLRIDPPNWDEPAIVPEVTLGKRCARLDARTAHGLATLRTLFQHCDVILHGYRPGALERLGLGEAQRLDLNPEAIDVGLDAYGFSGPWAHRRGFDSLVQMSTGIAAEGMRLAASQHPRPLPVQALDHATGYLLAAAVIYGLSERRESGRVIKVRCSLARTAKLLIDRGLADDVKPFPEERAGDWSATLEHTDWGPARRVRFPVQIEDCPAFWEYPARQLGSAAASWRVGR